MKAKAFAPGHISGFFEPVYKSQDFNKSGSRGSGINITLGATTQITAEPDIKQNINTYINNKKTNAIVTQLAIKYLIGNAPLNIQIQTQLDLPTGQGLGMSGASALSATYALSEIIKTSKEQALKAAHCAEIQLGTGLGDVIASSFGGIEIRREAGLPPWGMIEHIPGQYEIVLCIIGKKITTKKILTDPKKINDITHYGRYCMKKMLEKPSINNLLLLSQQFTQNTGLADKQILNAINAVKQHGLASMCMLGNSIFCIGQTDRIRNTLTAFGKVYTCTVDQLGARILQ